MPSMVFGVFFTCNIYFRKL